MGARETLIHMCTPESLEDGLLCSAAANITKTLSLRFTVSMPATAEPQTAICNCALTTGLVSVSLNLIWILSKSALTYPFSSPVKVNRLLQLSPGHASEQGWMLPGLLAGRSKGPFEKFRDPVGDFFSKIALLGTGF